MVTQSDEMQRYEADLLVIPKHGCICDEYRNIKYEIKRMGLGHLCGYVYLPEATKVEDQLDFQVHGGITYNDGKKIGFDCAHFGDWMPYFSFKEAIYKNYNFVKHEIENLIDQILEKNN